MHERGPEPRQRIGLLQGGGRTRAGERRDGERPAGDPVVAAPAKELAQVELCDDDEVGREAENERRERDEGEPSAMLLGREQRLEHRERLGRHRHDERGANCRRRPMSQDGGDEPRPKRHGDGEEWPAGPAPPEGGVPSSGSRRPGVAPHRCHPRRRSAPRRRRFRAAARWRRGRGGAVRSRRRLSGSWSRRASRGWRARARPRSGSVPRSRQGSGRQLRPASDFDDGALEQVRASDPPAALGRETQVDGQRVEVVLERAGEGG